MVQGNTLYTIDPLNAYITDVTFDFDGAIYGWVMEVECNYPEAQTISEIYVRNNTVYSGDVK